MGTSNEMTTRTDTSSRTASRQVSILSSERFAVTAGNAEASERFNWFANYLATGSLGKAGFLDHCSNFFMSHAMSTVQIVEIDAIHPEFSAAVVLFDRYRSFYGKPSNPSLAEHYLRERLEAGESTVLLARLQDQWVGFCQLYRSFSSIACARLVILNDLYVEEGHRSSGVGRSLIAHARTLAQREHAARLLLQTEETNVRAQALYEAQGFERDSGFVNYSMCLCPV